MQVHIRFAGSLPVLLGRASGEKDVEMQPGSSLGDVVDALRLRGDVVVAYAVNGTIRGRDHVMQEGDEVVALLPLAGG